MMWRKPWAGAMILVATVIGSTMIILALVHLITN